MFLSVFLYFFGFKYLNLNAQIEFDKKMQE